MDIIEKAAAKAEKTEKVSLVERAAQSDTDADRLVLGADGSGAPASKPKRTSRYAEIDLAGLASQGYITPDSPPNTTAEEFRLIKRSLLLNAFAKGEAAIPNGNLILVTSSRPNEGKTFGAINLALSIASEQDLTVLLVDADFAKPEILAKLGLKGGKGLMDVVSDPDMDLSDCLIRTNIPNLTVLPAGRQHNRTTEMLASDRMEAMMREIALRYRDRVVIFDSPPALASSVAPVLALHVGQVLFVVEAEKTTDIQLREALGLVSACEHTSLMLNKTKFAGGKRYGSYYGYGSAY
ncbi:MAG: XrtA-associated tyrosine autokinase [Sphingomonadales bacterium]|nr:XrtA-associated tyrosine autokinase [Sphingomonadales bacterium]